MPSPDLTSQNSSLDTGVMFSNVPDYKKIVGLTAALILVAAWFYSGFLENGYVNHPRYPNPAEGLIVPFVVKGIVVYITEGQRAFLDWLRWIEIGSGTIAVLVIVFHGGDPFKSRTR